MEETVIHTKIRIERSTSTAHRLLHYDGACGNVHGHNLDWEIEVHVRGEVEDDNMPVDMKDISDVIDKTDHAILLNAQDPLADEKETWDLVDEGEVKGALWEHYEGGDLGDTILFDGDPTCEIVSQWLADILVQEFQVVEIVTVELAETDKYTVSTASSYNGNVTLSQS